MLPKSSKRAVAHPTRLVLCTALALALSACGGGGGSPGVVPGGVPGGAGATSLAVGSLNFTGGAPAKLPAMNSLQLNIPITNNGQPSTVATGLTVTSLCEADKTATLELGSLTNGVQSVTYTNNGCARGTDTITAQIGTSVQTITVGVELATVGAIQFVSSDAQSSSIVIKGSGGAGRAESAVLTFRVLDQSNQGLKGVDVDFTASTYTGGLVLSPTRATTDSNGNVTTTVTSGTIPTPVRIFAQAVRNGKTISGLSDTLTISTGLPVQKAMSLSATKYNLEGGNYDGVTTDITVRLADQYGNPISDGTAVSFVAEGGAVGTSARGACVTSGGGCSVPLSSQEFRPANGRVTVLAYVQGIENFIDSNGDGLYSCTNYTAPDGSVPAVYRPLVDICVSGGEPFTDQADPFLDAGLLSSVFGLEKTGPFSTLDGIYTAANGDLPIPYNSTTYRAAGNGRWGLNYIWRQAEFVFSGSTARMARVSCSATSCTDSDAGAAQTVTTTSGTSCAPVNVAVRLFDFNNNPLPADSTVTIVDPAKVTVSPVSPNIIPSTAAVGGTFHHFTVTPDATCSLGSFGLKITTPKGISTTYGFVTN